MENNNNQNMNGFQGNIATSKEAIGVIKKYWKEFLVGFIAVILISVISQVVPDFFMPKDSEATASGASLALLGAILAIVLMIISYVIQIGFYKILIDGVDGVKPNVRDLYLQYRRFPSYIFTVVVGSIISIIGLFLFVFTIFPLTARYQYSLLFVIDKKVGMAESLKLSDMVTRGSLWKLIKFDIFLALINMVWLIPVIILAIAGAGVVSVLPLIGLVFTIPVSIVAYVVSYKKFRDNPAQNVVEHNKKMVGIIALLFAILLVIMVIIGGAIAAMVVSNPIFKSMMEQGAMQSSQSGFPYLTTDESSSSGSNNLMGDDAFIESFKTSFVESCSQSGQSEKTCTCIVDYIADNYTEDELLALGNGNTGSAEFTKKLTDAAAKCTVN